MALNYKKWMKKLEQIANSDTGIDIGKHLGKEVMEFYWAETDEEKINELEDVANCVMIALLEYAGKIDYQSMLIKLLNKDKKYGTEVE